MRIIYTPETDNFRFGDIGRLRIRHPGDVGIKRLRENYGRLEEQISDLPIKAGMVSYDELFKKKSREMQEKVENPTTSYMPLDILKQALDLRKEDMKNLLSREYVHRTLSFLLRHGSIILDPSLRSRKEIFFGAAIPEFEEHIKVISELIKTVKEAGGKIAKVARTDRIEKMMENLKKNFSTFGELEGLYQEIEKRFEANRVSRNFPLYFLPPNSYPPFFFTVSLVDKIETPDYIPKLLEDVEAGCKASGLEEIPEDIRREIMKGQTDKFGETELILNDLETFLTSLPEPKTIITDLYIMDQFPQLAEMNPEFHEFMLA